MTAQGHPRATFNRAIERGNLLVAETVLREIGRVSLAEMLQLTALIAVKDPRRHARVSARWLAYDGARGLAADDAGVAVAHARTVASLERTAHVFVEGTIQRAAQAVPGLIGSLDLAYVSLHLAVTGSALLWLHRRRPNVFPFVRTTLLVASGVALIGFVVFPTAPPRLAALGIADRTSGHHLTKIILSAANSVN